MNKVTLIGNLTRDPELSETTSKIKFCNFSIAVSRSRANSEGKRETDFFNCVAWRGLAESIAKYLAKGNKVAVSGEIQQNTFEDKDGKKHSTYRIMVNGIEFLTSKKKDGETAPAQLISDDTDDTDIPF